VAVPLAGGLAVFLQMVLDKAAEAAMLVLIMVVLAAHMAVAAVVGLKLKMVVMAVLAALKFTHGKDIYETRSY
jgi:hypothetical protein